MSNKRKANSPASFPQPRVGQTLLVWLLPFVLLLVTFGAFEPVRSAEFLNWDDDKLLVENQAYRGLGAENIRWMFTTTLLAQYQPISWLTYAVDYLRSGTDPHVYHLTNLLLHFGAVLVFYFVALRLLCLLQAGSALMSHPLSVRLAAALATLLFAVHPLRVETVAWLANRGYLISALCYLLACLWYLKYAVARAHGRRGGGWYALSLLVFAVSLLARPNAMVLGAVLILFDVVPLGRLELHPRRWFAPGTRGVLIEKVPFLLLGLVGAAFGWWVKSSGGTITDTVSYPLAARVAMTIYGLVFYLGKTLWPSGLLPLYEKPAVINPLSAPYLASLGALVGITWATFAFRRRWPAGWLLWLYYLLMIAPVCGLLTFGPQLVADRYTHLSCMGWALLAGAGFLRAWPRGQNDRRRRTLLPLVAGGALVIVVVLSLATHRQCRYWLDGEALWSRTLWGDADSCVANCNLGMILSQRGEQELGRAEEARAGGQQDEAEEHRAQARRELDVAEGLLQRSLVVNARYAKALANLGNIRLLSGRYHEAIDYYQRALEEEPRVAKTYSNIAIAWVGLGRPDLAEEHLLQAMAIDPQDAEVHFNLGMVYRGQGRFEEAGKQIIEALRLREDYPKARQALEALERRRQSQR